MQSCVVSVEHAGNTVPPRYRALFGSALLASHRAYDPGALSVGRSLARALAAPLFAGTYTRLLVDLNRSLGHRALFAPKVPVAERAAIVERYYAPFRAAVLSAVEAGVACGRVVHVSSHSFTPRLAGVVRNAEVGLLYDPSRRLERALADDIASRLRLTAPELRVRRNYPYRGVADGHVHSLRKHFAARAYVGIELELSQAVVRAARFPQTRAALVEAVADAIAEL